MNERLTKVKTDSVEFWKSRTKNQKGALIGTVIGVILIAALITYFSTRTKMVPLFTELTPKEAGEISEVLASQGVKYEIAKGSTNILVPEDEVDNLKLSLASQGYPSQEGVNATFFTENAGFGMTDNEFNVIKEEAIKTELENLIKKIDGIKDANVMITMPEKGVFVDDTVKEATAAVVLKTAPGQQFTEEQIRTLYNLVAKSIPNLSVENITISNQYSEYFDLDNATGKKSSVESVEGQMQIKKTVERDIQRQVQQMLGTLMGQDKVVVSVTTDIDFHQEKREENLVEPVDEENMEGIEISAQRITETYTGEGAATGTPEAENVTDNFTDYREGTNGNGDYERVEETINNEVNRIKKEIQESPYKLRDLGIQVMVEPPNPEDVASLPDEVRTDIEKILTTIVRTSIDKDYAENLTDEQIENKIAVSVQQFRGTNTTVAETTTIPWWIWVVGGILLAAILLLVFFIVRSKKQYETVEELSVIEEQEQLLVEDINDEKETESTIRRKQLEKMAKEKPEEFAKLLRSWIAEE